MSQTPHDKNNEYFLKFHFNTRDNGRRSVSYVYEAKTAKEALEIAENKARKDFLAVFPTDEINENFLLEDCRKL